VGYAERRKRGLEVTWDKALLIQGVLFISTLAGCATQLVYPYPDGSPGSNTNRVIACTRIDDQRIDRSFDEAITTNPLDELSAILKKELESTGLFDTVVVMSTPEAEMPQDRPEIPINFIVNSALVEIRWDDSECKSTHRAIGLSSLLTFGFGGIAGFFASCDTNSLVRLHIAVKGVPDGQQYIDEFYSGQTKERVSYADWYYYPNTAPLTVKSIKDVMNQLKADLAIAFK
jgi:hypothetical protein